MKRVIVFVFALVILGSCAKNGEYKNCDDVEINFEFYNIEPDPDAEVCSVEYYENDKLIWSKTTVDGVVIEENRF